MDETKMSFNQFLHELGYKRGGDLCIKKISGGGEKKEDKFLFSRVSTSSLKKEYKKVIGVIRENES